MSFPALREIAVDTLDIAVAETATVYSDIIALPGRGSVKQAIAWRFASPGSVTVKLELEVCFEQPEASDQNVASTKFVVSGSALVANETAKTLIPAAFAPIAAPFARIKATGLSGNDAGTTAQIFISRADK